MRRPVFKTCPVCQRGYASTALKQRYCSSRCWHQDQSTRQRGADMSKASAGRLAMLKARARAKVAAEFGALTDREIALVKLAFKKGYHKGYYARYFSDPMRQAS